MSWQMALMAASTAFSAASQYSATRAQAKFGAAQAELQKTQAIDNANAAKLQGAQQEIERRREFLVMSEFNKNKAKYNIESSASFLALRRDNKARLEDSVRRIQLQALEGQRRFLLTAHSAEVEGQAFRHMGQTAWMGATATLLKGGTKMAMLRSPGSLSGSTTMGGTSNYKALTAGTPGTGPAYPPSGASPKIAGLYT